MVLPLFPNQCRCQCLYRGQFEDPIPSQKAAAVVVASLFPSLIVAPSQKNRELE